MIRNVLQAIGGIEIYPIISLLIFFGLFASVLIWFFHFENNLKLKKPNPNRVISDIEIIPLEQLASLLKRHLTSKSHS
ncbi:MAG: CcoQ/FixQ family Cbb3-type cytochrome c oxidase assembly chaperone [Candidatus Kapaibacteriota bacterium]